MSLAFLSFVLSPPFLTAVLSFFTGACPFSSAWLTPHTPIGRDTVGSNTAPCHATRRPSITCRCVALKATWPDKP
ncbi:hypothetical protein AUP68_03416 [Ilyonectria robusta]